MNRSFHGYKPAAESYLGDGIFDHERANKQLRCVLSGHWVLVPHATTLPVFDQGEIGSCEAQAACGALGLLAPEPVIFSAQDLYWRALWRDGSLPHDAGTNAETIQFILKHTGVSLEKWWPYDGRSAANGGSFATRPELKALEDAYDHRLEAAHRIVTRGPMRERDVQAAIDAGRPVQIGGNVSPQYERYFDELHSDSVAFGSAQEVVGGHAQVIVGYCWILVGVVWYLVRNSWGAQGGLKEFPGHALVTGDYLDSCDELFPYYVAPALPRAA